MTNADPSSIRADNDPKFYTRFKWVGLGMLGFMIYCLYDAGINYPLQQQKWEALEELKATEIEKGLTEEELETALPEAWNALAVERGWDPSKKFEERTSDIYSNYGMAVFSGLIGLWMLYTVVSSNGRWIEVNNEGLNSSSGDSITFEEATFLEKKQWDDKGIAWLHFERDGKPGRFLIDNFKYMREETNAILCRIEEAIGTDKIRGGAPEAEKAIEQEEGPVEQDSVEEA